MAAAGLNIEISSNHSFRQITSVNEQFQSVPELTPECLGKELEYGINWPIFCLLKIKFRNSEDVVNQKDWIKIFLDLNFYGL